jgi:hypothetical protein
MSESPFHVPTEVIDLAAIPPLRQGQLRNIRVLPGFPGLILKTIRPERVDMRGFVHSKNAIRNLRPRGCQTVPLRELEEFLIQCRRRHRQVGYRLPIAHVHGLVATTEGIGMLVERIADAQGGLAPTIGELINTNAIGSGHVAALETWWRTCRADHVVVGDLHAGNIAYTECRSGGPECVCIDGFGEKSFFPVHRLSRRINARKLDRVMRRMMERLSGRPLSTSP